MSENENHFAAALFNAVSGGLIVLDADERILRWNTWMAAASGFAEAEVRGRTLAEVFPGANLKRLSYATDAALKSNAPTIITHALSPSLLPLRTLSGRDCSTTSPFHR